MRLVRPRGPVVPQRGSQSGSAGSYVPELEYLRGARVVVDVGAGRGQKALWLAQRGSYVVALDINERYAERMPRHPLLERVVAAAEALPVRSGAAEGVLAWNVLMWAEAPRAAAELMRVARPGARLALSMYKVRTGRPWTRRWVRGLLESLGWRVEGERYSGVQYRVVAGLSEKRPAARVVRAEGVEGLGAAALEAEAIPA